MKHRSLLSPMTLCAGTRGASVSFAPEGIVDNGYLVIVARSRQRHMMQLVLTFHSGEDDDEDDLHINLGLIPDVRTVLGFDLCDLDAQTLFLPRTPGKLKTVVFGKKIRREDVARISIGLPKNYIDQRVELYDIYFSPTEPEYVLDAKPLVDPIGQANFYDWPGKTPDAGAMVAYLKKQSDKPSAAYPAGMSTCGGSQRVRFAATGYFRVEKHKGRFVLADPEGYPFFSVGPDCVIPGEGCRMEGLDGFFDELPPKEESFAPAWGHMDVMGASDYFNFGTANLIRAFGDDWWDKWAGITKNRLIEWGCNTVANWSNGQFARSCGLPYVWPLQNFPATRSTIFRDFPDVFSDEYQQNAEAFATQIDEFAGDAMLIGYFLRNEPHWAFAEGVNIAEEMLEREEDFACKQAFIEYLRGKYSDIAAFNTAWGLAFTDFAQLNTPLKKARGLSDAARADLEEWTGVMIEQYVGLPSAALKKRDPHHLNLGMRYAFINDPALLRGSEHFDVFSLNCYSTNPAKHIKRVASMTGLPVMIGEFHFGAIDRGLMGAGLRGVTDQRQRGVAYRHYIEAAAAEPFCVGAHYFQYNDQAYLGRFDGENHQIGLVDCCHHPYPEFIAALKRTHRTLYDIVFGDRLPSKRAGVEIPQIGF